MNRVNLFACLVVCVLLGTSVFSEVDKGPVEEPVFEGGAPEIREPGLLTKSLADKIDEEVAVVDNEFETAIEALNAEIASLEDKNQEPELQRQIEVLKLEQEIALIEAQLLKAEERKDSELAAKLTAEIEHLSRLDEPAIGNENEQPAP